jgi:hypothetical protein
MPEFQVASGTSVLPAVATRDFEAPSPVPLIVLQAAAQIAMSPIRAACGLNLMNSPVSYRRRLAGMKLRGW